MLSGGFGDSGGSGDFDRVSAELELGFIDFESLDPVVESRWWNPKLSCRPRRPPNPASGLGQRRLNNLLLAAPLDLTLGGC